MPRKKEVKTREEVLAARVLALKEARKAKLPGGRRSIEDIWREIDLEFTPHELEFSSSVRRRLEADDELGLRSRFVRVGEDDDWQSNISSADFYVKVATAVGILVDMNPEAVFEPASKKFESNTSVAYATWRHSWESSGARKQVKKFSFNLAKYGTAFARTYPKIIEMEKRIVREDGSEEKKRLVKFNDLCRENLNPWQVWVDEQARPCEPDSVSDWYFEKDYDLDKFLEEFPVAQFPKAGEVKEGMVELEKNDEGDKRRENKVTVGFYENQVRDEFTIWIPSARIVLHDGPLPNDEGKMGLWMAPWTFRDDRSIYGIGIWEIIRNDKYLYDRLLNMTMDQLMLAIYKMFFYKGVDVLGENGRLMVTPGKGEQVMDPSSLSWMNVPGPGQEAWKGLEYIKTQMDDSSGVPQQLSGKFAGRTLGQDLQAKETALERMKTPLDFICDALEEEGYISLSWMAQMYSTPELLEWETPEDLGAALKEWGLDDAAVRTYLAEAMSPKNDSELLFQEGETDEEGNVVPGKKFANVYRETPLKLSREEGGTLFESEKKRFFRFGVDLPVKKLSWRGIIRIKPQSILVPSKELTKRNDLDLFNLVFPSIQAMAQAPMLVPVLLPPIKQIIKAYDKDGSDWLDEKYFQKLYEEATAPKPPAPPEAKLSLAVAYKDLSLPATEAQKEILNKYFGIKVEEPLFVDSMTGEGPQSASAFPSSLAGNPGEQPTTDMKEGVSKISPVADMKRAPTTLSGAVEGSIRML